MLYLLRHLLSILILPVTAVIVIPAWLAREYAVTPSWPGDPSGRVALAVGLASGLTGLVLFAASLQQFFVDGRGTLAPWDPPRRLVVRGPYRYVRNPMISGIIFILCGVALCLRSRPHAAWAAVFIVANLVYIPLLEEPDLANRFGDAYRRYRAGVRRFVPRLRPWTDRE